MKVIIEGNINSGKSRLIKFLSENLKDVNIIDSGFVYFHPDPKYNLIKRKDENPKDWTFLMQLTFMKLLNVNQNEIFNKKINIFSRSIYSAHNIFTKHYREQNLITEEEYEYLNKLYNKMICENKVKTDLLVYFKSKSDILKERETNNPFKTSIDQFQIHYDELLEKIKEDFNIKIIYIIDSSKSPNEIIVDYKKILKILLN